MVRETNINEPARGAKRSFNFHGVKTYWQSHANTIYYYVGTNDFEYTYQKRYETLYLLDADLE